MTVLNSESGTLLSYEPSREVDVVTLDSKEIEQFRYSTSQRIVPVGASFSRQVVLTALPLILSDLAALVCSAWWSYVAISLIGYPNIPLGTLLPVLSVTMLLVFGFLELYPAAGMHRVLETRQLLLGTSLFMMLSAVCIAAYSPGPSPLGSIFVTWMLGLFLIPTFRSGIRSFCTKSKWWGQPALILGKGATADRLYKSLDQNCRQGIKPVGLVYDQRAEPEGKEANVPHLGESSNIVDVARQHSAYWLFVVQSELSSNARTFEHEVEKLAGSFPNVVIIPDNMQIPTLWNRCHDCNGLTGINIQERLMLPWPRLLKRTMDIVLTVVGGLMISPLFLFIAICIKFSSPGPVLLSTKRVGRNGKEIHPLKFRSMVSNADDVLNQYLEENPEMRAEWKKIRKLKNDPRVTRIGQFLRKTSLDELPQLWNVLKGDMSLVGPRPIFDDEIPRYRDEFRLYSEVSPGLTGLWQISGRNNTTYAERVEYDRFYVRNWSLWLDIHILMRTLKVVLLREGAY
ncbi:UDP-glucose:undecaprenyl-phosphate glucose-1-phosphate transferase [Polystyrenella longa]|uniref:UDP-glucose:undecaprenyl-phosphate glucose-1-phosphate transferase n=1 Tax=Polystyrenella longa TaxID=2528007 RepID=A0A518CQD5_9PLAN|nr:undecaprenyl-phosphate galactose phosphotransferase WbaP [Polystyrenella longa]QDU81414.1 UDP-glucose:undecaprenyl-phosphate glucose-1-phosphate transferase [Polystyrenella longa]